MTKTLPDAVEQLRPDWLRRVVNDLQGLAGEIVWGEVGEDDSSSLVEKVLAIGAPATPTEKLVLRALLLESACRIGSSLHVWSHAGVGSSCSLDESRILLQFFSGSHDDSRQVFGQWATFFCQALRHAHPPSKARQVAAAIRRNFHQSLDMRRLARGVEMSPSGLRLAFRTEFGRTPRDYQASLRLLSAIKEVASEKIEAVALVIGFRSKKNFYRMFRSLTGLTPTNFRSLSQDEQRKLISKAWRDVHGFSLALAGSKARL